MDLKTVKIKKTKTYKKLGFPWFVTMICLGLGLTLVAGDWYVCAIYKECVAEASTPLAAAPAKIEKVFERIHFEKNKSQVHFSNEITETYSKVKNMDEIDPEGKEFVVTGKYFNGETEEIGLSRAQAVKDLLKDKSWYANIKTKAERVESDFSPEKYQDFSQASRMEIFDTNDKYQIRNQTIYFALNASNPQDSYNIKSFLKDVAQNYKSGKIKDIQIVGHTDNQGKGGANYKLGLSRAKMIKKLLVDYGVETNSVNAVSKGESEPAEKNTTTEGRALNRRVVLITK